MGRKGGSGRRRRVLPSTANADPDTVTAGDAGDDKAKQNGSDLAMSSTIIPCPKSTCGYSLRIPTDRVLRNVRCPVCGTGVTVPQAGQQMVPVNPWGAPPPEITSVPSLPPRHERQPQREVAIRQDASVSRRTLGDVVREGFPNWFSAPNGVGQALAPIDTTPDVSEIHILDMWCSHVSQPFSQTFAKSKLGHPFRLADNGDPDSYLQLAQHHGVRISRGSRGMGAMGDFDWSNWQCQHCHHGQIVGHHINFFQCGHCGELNCGSSIQTPRNAAATAICGKCRGSSVLEIGKLETFSTTKRLAVKDR